jgi:hypothetical protein
MSNSPDYSGFTKSLQIPFTNEDEPGSTPAIAVAVNGVKIENAGLDSGSSIFALGQNFVPSFQEKDKLRPGSVGYTSGRLWEGYWYKATVTFQDTWDAKVPPKIKVTSKVDVLVITKQTLTGYEETKGEDGKMHREKIVTEEHDPEIHYIGIGFGIVDDGNKGYTPNKNPLLSVTQYNDEPVEDRTFRRGYILRRRSVEIGLTKENIKSFGCTKLSNSSSPNTKWYWNRVNFALQLNGKKMMYGDALIDTGVSVMTIWSTDYQAEDYIKDDTDGSILLRPESVVKFYFPNEKINLAEYSFTWLGKDGVKESLMPKLVYYDKSAYDNRATVNTGQNFYYEFETLFDAYGGFWGVKKT